MTRKVPKYARRCSGCLEEVPARFRTMLSRFLCEGCYDYWRTLGRVPDPAIILES